MELVSSKVLGTRGRGHKERRLTPGAADTREAGEETAESVLYFFIS